MGIFVCSALVASATPAFCDDPAGAEVEPLAATVEAVHDPAPEGEELAGAELSQDEGGSESPAAKEFNPEEEVLPPEETHVGPEEDQVFFEAYWDQGIKYRLLGRPELDTEDHGYFGSTHLTREPLIVGQVRFRLHVDAAAYAEDRGLQSISGGIEVRRSFLNLSGIFFNFIYPIDFKVEFGVITSSFFFNQGYLALRDLPYVGTFKLGQYDAPFSFSTLMSSRDQSLMERSSPVQAFSPGTKVGTQLANYLSDLDVTWALGWFADGQDTDIGDASDSFARLVGRVTWVPYESDAGAVPSLVHVGMANSYLFSSKDSIRYQSRPESFLAPVVVDTGDMDAKNAYLLGTEAAFIYGPISGQFEYLHSFVRGGSTGGVNFPGLYLMLSAMLTGESRPYNHAAAVFGQLIPHHSFSIWDKTWGAVELAGRYSYVDLDSGSVSGGTMHAFTLGPTWYWNRYIRWQFNYGLSDVDDGIGGEYDGLLHTFQMRFQLEI